MKHYEVLGIARDATRDEIRAAFKLRAKAAHPDREGGSEEAMSAVNRAYQCLKDAAKRAAYDQSGDENPQQEQDVVKGLFAQTFVKVMQENETNWPFYLRKALNEQISDWESKKANVLAIHGRLSKQTSKLKHKKGVEKENIMLGIVNDQLGGVNRELGKTELMLQRFRLALKIVDDYEIEAPTRPSQEYMGHTIFTTGFR